MYSYDEYPIPLRGLIDKDVTLDFDRTIIGITCDCYIREYYKPGLLSSDSVTRMTRRKSKLPYSAKF